MTLFLLKKSHFNFSFHKTTLLRDNRKLDTYKCEIYFAHAQLEHWKKRKEKKKR